MQYNCQIFINTELYLCIKWQTIKKKCILAKMIIKTMRIKKQWMSWDDLVPFKNQLIELEVELTQNYHYPDMHIPIEYARDRVNALEQHMKNGNTFFWAVTDGNLLLGYYWAYISKFIDVKRWNLRSLMFRDLVKSQGLGTEAIEIGLKKAKELGCQEAATEYVPWNSKMAILLERHGYRPSRIEVVRKL